MKTVSAELRVTDGLALRVTGATDIHVGVGGSTDGDAAQPVLQVSRSQERVDLIFV